MQFQELVYDLTRLMIAFLLALPVAWNRERKTRSAGLRTFPLVAIASCGYILLGRTIFSDSPEAQSRVLQGLMTGIGFIGGGAILKQGSQTHGTATAASIWSTGAIGAAAAYDHYEIAILLALINFATFRWLTSLKPSGEGDGEEDATSHDS